MDDEAVARLADIVAERVFKSMSQFVDVLEDLVRDNEALHGQVRHLELLLFGPEARDAEAEEASDDELDEFFDVDSAWGPEEDESKPTFD
jgi:hypothetical protein